MRGVYGNTRRRLAATTTRTVVGAEAEFVPRGTQNRVLEDAKVGAVIMLSVVAVVTAGKVLSTHGSRWRNY